MPSHEADDVRATRKIALVVIGPLLGVSKACDLLGFSRDTYYRLAAKVRAAGFGSMIAALGADEKQPRLNDEVATAVLRISDREPLLGKAKVAGRARALGLNVSASRVRTIWKRHGLESAAQRTERARTVGLHAEQTQPWDAVIAEQRRVALELARVAQALERERRRAPTRAGSRAALRDSNGPREAVDLFRSLFGAAPSGSKQESAPVAASNGTALLDSLFTNSR